jgi:putative ABC transport system permease protein
MTTLLRAGADPTSYVASVREIVLKLDSGVALRGVGTLQKEVTDSIGIIRIMGILMGVFGMVALALSLVGVYGVLSESVAQRTHEIGIRVALGANPRDLMRLVLAHALKLTLIGLAMAVPPAFVLSRLLAGVIHGVVTVDLAILAEFSFLLVLVALVAGFLPARRAMGVDPMVALRRE